MSVHVSIVGRTVPEVTEAGHGCCGHGMTVSMCAYSYNSSKRVGSSFISALSSTFSHVCPIHVYAYDNLGQSGKIKDLVPVACHMFCNIQEKRFSKKMQLLGVQLIVMSMRLYVRCCASSSFALMFDCVLFVCD